MSSFLDPADAVAVGDATIVPDGTRPVAAVVTGDDVRSTTSASWRPPRARGSSTSRTVTAATRCPDPPCTSRRPV
ncbi:hypothetical protein KZI27_19885 [Curtobacterium sp. TC1]|uniref:hypothetical protein n=1 Tax=Curtobacterium sp. TC1 TaxID=2862880 RepID=UPI001C9B94E8|nr:hypothetical protein [Curtobacterium sp. TC1]QZQ55460.1 hypothetical protein KZI27_19885 [Curtobacterium sp. TC1]